MKSLVAIAAITLVAMASTVSAQTPPSSVNSDAQTEGGSLSSKLSKSDGVITPKNDVDPGIHAEAPVPHPNSTPVVPPAATGGGTAK